MALTKFNRRAVESATGAIVAGATVTFYNQASGLPVAVYEDSSGDTSLGSSVLSEANGEIPVFMTPGVYRITVELGASLLAEYTYESAFNATAAQEDASIRTTLLGGGAYKKYAAVSNFLVASPDTDVVEIVGYHGGWAETVAGPKGGHKRHKTGATVATTSVPNAANSTEGTAANGNVGYSWTADGVEWEISAPFNTHINCYGITADGPDIAETFMAVVNKYAAYWSGSTLIGTGAIFTIDGGTYNCSNLSFIGKNDVWIRATGGWVFLDFNLVSSGTAFLIGEDATYGGSQRWRLDGIKFTDSRSTSTVDTMFKFVSGPTGASPPRTSGFLEINQGGITKYKNTSGVGCHLLNVSHVDFNLWDDAYELGSGTALKLQTSISINTGVFNFNNCLFRSKVTQVHIDAAAQLIDGVNFFGGFLANDEQAAARENILIEGALGVADLNFIGTHIECRDATENSVVKVAGALYSATFTLNASGSSTASPKYFIDFQSGSSAGAVLISDGCHFLRFKNQGSGGYVVHCANDVVTSIDNPIKIGSYKASITTPGTALVDADGISNTIHKSILSTPFVTSGVRISTGPDRVYPLDDSATPNVAGGRIFLINYLAEGTHDGGNGSSALGDSSRDWVIDEFVGKTIENVTDGSSGTITANTSGGVTATLSGGSDNDWDDGDAYRILRSVTTFTDFVGEYHGQQIEIYKTAGASVTFTNGASTIRCAGNVDLTTLGNNDIVGFTRTGSTNWIQNRAVLQT